MKAGRKPKLNQIQKEFIWDNHKLGSTYLGKLFNVSADTVRRVKVEKDLQDKRYLKKPEPKPEPNYRAKSNGYDKLSDFAKEKGYRNITEAIDGYGSRISLMEDFKKQSA